MIRRMRAPAALLIVVVGAYAAHAQSKPRARDLGVPFDGVPGPLNAITDVRGVEVGLTTIIRGQGVLKPGEGPVRTGVTVIFPRGKASGDPVFAGWFSQNGNGEMTGTTWIDEGGFMEGPVFITNTHSVGVVRDAAIDSASGGPLREGNVGGGTGMICYEFKCGTGTASRVLPPQAGGYTVGVLVQANHGRRPELRMGGVPVGREMPVPAKPRAGGLPPVEQEQGSIIIIVATDAPLLPHQLERLARRATMGLARTGATSGNGSGDIFLAFSTENAGVAAAPREVHVNMLSNSRISAVFSATVEATEEAILNALVAAETMTGTGGTRVDAIPHERLGEVMRAYGRE